MNVLPSVENMFIYELWTWMCFRVWKTQVYQWFMEMDVLQKVKKCMLMNDQLKWLCCRVWKTHVYQWFMEIDVLQKVKSVCLWTTNWNDCVAEGEKHMFVIQWLIVDSWKWLHCRAWKAHVYHSATQENDCVAECGRHVLSVTRGSYCVAEYKNCMFTKDRWKYCVAKRENTCLSWLTEAIVSQSVKNARVSMTHGYDGVAECKERPTADRKITLPRGLGVGESHFFFFWCFLSVLWWSLDTAVLVVP